MFQPGEELRFALEPLLPGGEHSAGDKLQRDGLLQPVGALGTVDHTHSALGDELDGAKMSEFLIDQAFRGMPEPDGRQ